MKSKKHRYALIHAGLDFCSQNAMRVDAFIADVIRNEHSCTYDRNEHTINKIDLAQQKSRKKRSRIETLATLKESKDFKSRSFTVCDVIGQIPLDVEMKVKSCLRMRRNAVCETSTDQRVGLRKYLKDHIIIHYVETWML